MRKKVYYFDMDGVLANFHKEPYSYENAISREWIANLEPFMNNIAVVKNLMQAGKSIYINSLAASEDARQGKLEWLAKYLPEIRQDHIIIIVGGGRKADYMKTKTGTLVDDKISNCRQWTKISGQPYYHLEYRGATVKINY